MADVDTHELLETVAERTLPGELGPGAGGQGERGPGQDGEPGVLVPGERLGRYAILEQVGAGGMGLVYAAYDPQLDRKVALKVLHRKFAASDAASRRLLHEARAMARLAHPNVVAVHDLGDVNGRVFVAMEFIEGPTLRAWLEAEPRDWQAIVRTFLLAGEGLAAAHAAGMVHRDFKPDNVMLNARGRPRVLDFGLAREGSAPSPNDAPQPADGQQSLESVTGRAATLDEELSSLSALSARSGGASTHAPLDLTATGGMAGTPAYMSPEQHLGEPLDARSDQFSFCVALWEALFGQRPYAGDSVQVLAFQVTQGELRPAPKDSEVPSRIIHALMRGLSVDPQKRWPDLAQLMIELQVQAPRSGASRWVLAGAATLALGLGGVVLMSDDDAPQCTEPQRHLRGVWDAPMREALHAAFQSSGAAGADDAFARVAHELDRRVDVWGAAWSDACEATYLRKVQSARVHDQRTACLSRRRTEMRAFVTLLRTPDADLVSRSPKLALDLHSIAPCSDLAFIAADVEPPSDPKLVAQVAAVQEVFAKADVFELTGHYAQGLEALHSLDAQPGFMAYAPAAAEYKILEGLFLSREGEDEGAELALREGFLHARRADHRALAVRAAAELVMVVGDRQQRFDEAKLWAQLGHVEAERSATDLRYLANLVSNEGSLAGEQGEYDAAIGHYKAAIKIWESMSNETGVNVAGARMNMGTALSSQGKYAEADAQMDQAIAALRTHLGEGHPDVAAGLSNKCMLQYGQGRLDEAQRSCAEADEISRTRLRPEHPVREAVLTNLANLHYAREAYDEALETYERLLKISATRVGEPGSGTAGLLSNIGNVLKEQGKNAEAAEKYRRSIELYTVAYGIDHPKTGFPLQGLGSVLMEQGEHDEAARVLGQAVVAWERAGENHPLLGYPLTSMGHNELMRGRRAAACAPLERALKIRTGPEGDPVLAAETQGYLAQALAKRDRSRARDLAAASLEVFEAEGTPEEIAEAQAIVAQLGD